MATSLIATGIKFPDNTTQTTAGKAVGVGQTWQNVTATRSLAVTYTNSTAKPIMVSVSCGPTTASGDIQLRIDGILIQRLFTNPDTSSLTQFVWGIVPVGSTYKIDTTNLSLSEWNELR